MHPNAMIITQPDLLRLTRLLRTHRTTRPYLCGLERQLSNATVVGCGELPADVVTMGSRFRFTDRRTGVAETYRLVYPEEADLDRERLSVFAPIGTAVLGRRARQTVWWRVPWGLRVVRIDAVVFQPEAHGRRPAEDDEEDEDADSLGVGIASSTARRTRLCEPRVSRILSYSYSDCVILRVPRSPGWRARSARSWPA